ncbi:12734_t:CDS:2 [Ambispora leptoticha]|uniref:12734_t:CDS:1 n=1 Tax=Ambispora leptoticha TaxID=144679 RepID=A0A9N9BXD6_9GLOM|nr:12734_t:CDS:2 [Ambispora leptoticha]
MTLEQDPSFEEELLRKYGCFISTSTAAASDKTDTTNSEGRPSTETKTKQNIANNNTQQASPSSTGYCIDNSVPLLTHDNNSRMNSINSGIGSNNNYEGMDSFSGSDTQSPYSRKNKNENPLSRKNKRHKRQQQAREQTIEQNKLVKHINGQSQTSHDGVPSQNSQTSHDGFPSQNFQTSHGDLSQNSQTSHVPSQNFQVSHNDALSQDSQTSHGDLTQNSQNELTQNSQASHDVLSRSSIASHAKLADPWFSKETFHSVALFIYFNVDHTDILPFREEFAAGCGFTCITKIFEYTDFLKEFSKYGFNRITEAFGYKTRYQITDAMNAAKEFTLECAINCWRNNKNLTLFCAACSKDNINIVSEFVKSIRKVCDNETLDVIVIRTDLAIDNHRSYVYETHRAGATCVVYCKSEYVASEIMDVFKTIKEKRARGRDKVDFYNKGEPYYEFTNFYRAKVTIDSYIWPTTEHYFQAQKFESKYTQSKIRHAYTAREAFMIARAKNDEKRRNWESSDIPGDIVFKEKVMEHAQMQKYTQNPPLRYKLLSTGTAALYEHTSNDSYWGDGGNDRKGLNRLGKILEKVRSQLMNEEINMLAKKYRCSAQLLWLVPQLRDKLEKSIPFTSN